MGLSDNSRNPNPSSPYLPSVKPNQQLTPAFVGKIISGIDKSTPRFGNGYQVGNYSSGSVMRFNQPFTAGAALTNFTVNAFTENGQAWATVSVGTVNRAIPKIASKYLDQSDTNGFPPKIVIPGNGYIVLEVTYEANKPFPSVIQAKYVATPVTTNENATSQYVLASVTGKAATKDNPPMVIVQQYHLEGNLAVNRFKIGASQYWWQWYTV